MLTTATCAPGGRAVILFCLRNGDAPWRPLLEGPEPEAMGRRAGGAGERGRAGERTGGREGAGGVGSDRVLGGREL